MGNDDTGRLPVELMLHIFNCLDSVAPSTLKIRQEPSLDLTKSINHILKDISCVSKRWRRIVMPLLFRDARLRIDIPWREEWSDCPACSSTTSTLSNTEDYGDRCHADMVEAYKNRPLSHNDTPSAGRSSIHMSTTRENFEQPDEASTAAWAWRFHHVLKDFCSFITDESLAASVRSLVVYTGRMLDGKLGRFPHQSAPREWRYPAAATFWQLLLSIIDPNRVVVLAPPTELACLTNAAIDTFGDW